MKTKNQIAIAAALMLSVAPISANAQMAVFDATSFAKMVEEYAQEIKTYLLEAQSDLNRTAENAKTNLLTIGIEKAKAEDQVQRENLAIKQNAIAASQVTSSGCNLATRGLLLDQTRAAVDTGTYSSVMSAAATLTGAPCNGGSSGAGSTIAGKFSANQAFDATPANGVYGVDQAGIAIGSGKTISEQQRSQFSDVYANFTTPQAMPAPDQIPQTDKADPKKAEELLTIQKDRFVVTTSRSAVAQIVAKLSAPKPGDKSEMDHLVDDVNQGWGSSDSAKAYGASLAQESDPNALSRHIIAQLGLNNALLLNLVQTLNGLAIVAHTESAGRAYHEGVGSKLALHPAQQNVN